MVLLIMAGVIPAIFLVEGGQAFRPSADESTSSKNWTGYLLTALALLLIALVSAYNLGEQASVALLLLLPSALAAFIQNILWLVQSHLADVRQSKVLAGLLVVDLVLLAALFPLTDLFIGSLVLIGGAMLTLAWAAWDQLGRAWGLVYLLVVLLGLYSGWRIDASRDLFPAIPWLDHLSSQLAYLVIILEALVLFRLMDWAMRSEKIMDGRKWALAALLAVPVLGLAGWQIATAAAWDVATDGLGGIVILQLTGAGGIAAAILTAWRQPPNRRVPVFILGLVLPLYMMAWMSFGTYGLDGPWGRVPLARTERRAASVNRAIQRYYASNHSYPTSLQELTPAYLLFLPTPFIIPGQDWCYQGGANFYRLGYVTRDFFSAPASVRVFAAFGQSPDPSWPCEDEAARYPAPPGFYGNQ